MSIYTVYVVVSIESLVSRFMSPIVCLNVFLLSLDFWKMDTTVSLNRAVGKFALLDSHLEG